MTYEYNSKEITFNIVWKGSNSMFHDMDGVREVKEIDEEDASIIAPKSATVFMFKVRDGICYLGVPYDKNRLRAKKFTHIGWKKFYSKEERDNAIENIKWMYRVIPGHPGNKYV